MKKKSQVRFLDGGVWGNLDWILELKGQKQNVSRCRQSIISVLQWTMHISLPSVPELKISFLRAVEKWGLGQKELVQGDGQGRWQAHKHLGHQLCFFLFTKQAWLISSAWQSWQTCQRVLWKCIDWLPFRFVLTEALWGVDKRELCLCAVVESGGGKWLRRNVRCWSLRKGGAKQKTCL